MNKKLQGIFLKNTKNLCSLKKYGKFKQIKNVKTVTITEKMPIELHVFSFKIRYQINN